MEEVHRAPRRMRKKMRLVLQHRVLADRDNGRQCSTDSSSFHASNSDHHHSTSSSSTLTIPSSSPSSSNTGSNNNNLRRGPNWKAAVGHCSSNSSKFGPKMARQPTTTSGGLLRRGHSYTMANLTVFLLMLGCLMPSGAMSLDPGEKTNENPNFSQKSIVFLKQFNLCTPRYMVQD